MDTKAIISRLLAAGVAGLAAHLAPKGITIDPASQATIVIGVYAGLHKIVEHFVKKS